MDKNKLILNPVIISIIFYIVIIIHNIMLFYLLGDNIYFEKFWYLRDAFSSIIFSIFFVVIKSVLKNSTEVPKAIFLNRIFKSVKSYQNFIIACFAASVIFILRFIPHVSYVINYKNSDSFGSQWVFDDLFVVILFVAIFPFLSKLFNKKTEYQSGLEKK
jgi:hypothetical protein